MLLLTMSFQHINTSLQIGDFVYFVPTLTSGTSTSVMVFDEGMYSNIIRFGEVFSINRANNTVEVMWDDNTTPAPTIDHFILFSKSKQVNTSSLLGYYANIGFENNSHKKAELFSVASEISESSK